MRSLATKISACAFRECSSLSKVVINSKKIDIECNAFLLSSSIKEIITQFYLDLHDLHFDSSINLTRK